jgi:hypothetical protein
MISNAEDQYYISVPLDVIKITDNLNIMSAGDKSSLMGSAKSWPFDVEVFIDSNHAVAAENSLVIEMNSVTSEVSVYFGNNLNIPKSAWQNITKAGNSDFSEGRLANGIKKIATEARESRVSIGVIQKENPDYGRPYREGAFWMIGFIIVYFGMTALLRDMKRRSNNS